jgi:SAM-dependent methyltransferase
MPAPHVASSMGDETIRFHPAVAAVYDPVQAYFERVQAPPHRRWMAGGLSGDVLELGVGTGAMVPYYAEQSEPPRLHGVEPDPGMYRQARATLSDHDVAMALTSARAEALPYAADSFDAVVEFGVLCSVPDVPTALSEVARVLGPDGEFRFFDHVRSAGLVGRSQDLLTPLWRRVGGNCQLNRTVGALLGDADGLAVEDHERLTVGHWPIREFVRGVAVPAGGSVG